MSGSKNVLDQKNGYLVDVYSKAFGIGIYIMASI